MQAIATRSAAVTARPSASKPAAMRVWKAADNSELMRAVRAWGRERVLF
jgi:hypothetical protein